MLVKIICELFMYHTLVVNIFVYWHGLLDIFIIDMWFLNNVIIIKTNVYLSLAYTPLVDCGYFGTGSFINSDETKLVL